MSTRMFSVFDQERYAMVPACDGELGSVVRVYRDFKNLGDVEFLKTIWPKVVLAMEYALKQWDLEMMYWTVSRIQPMILNFTDRIP